MSGRHERLVGVARDAARAVLRRAGLELRRARARPEELGFLRTLGVRMVLDVGANEGQFGRRMRALLPDATMHSFEPVAATYELLVRHTVGDADWHAHHLALGAAPGEQEIEVNGYSPSSSLLRMNSTAAREFPYLSAVRRETIRVGTLDTFAGDTRLAEPLFVKLDVQGYEDWVVQGGSATLARTTALLCEVSFVPLYDSQVLFEELHAQLRALGLRCAGMFDNIVGADGRILQADAILRPR